MLLKKYKLDADELQINLQILYQTSNENLILKALNTTRKIGTNWPQWTSPVHCMKTDMVTRNTLEYVLQPRYNKKQ